MSVLEYYSIDAPTYQLVQRAYKGKADDKIKCKSRREVESESRDLCSRLNEEILDHITHGFAKMLQNPNFRAFIDCLDKKIADEKPTCVEIRSYISDSPVKINFEYYNLRSMDVLGIKPSDFGLPSNFESQEGYDFWAFVLGLIKHIPHEHIEFTDSEGKPFLDYDSDTAFYDHMILDQLYICSHSSEYSFLPQKYIVYFAPQWFGASSQVYFHTKDSRDADEVFSNFVKREESYKINCDRVIRIHIKYVPPETPVIEKKSWY